MSEWFPEVRHGTALHAAGYGRGWLLTGWFRAACLLSIFVNIPLRFMSTRVTLGVASVFVLTEIYRSVVIRCPKCRALWSTPFRFRPGTYTENLVKCPRCDFPGSADA